MEPDRLLRTAAWYGDKTLELPFPDGWRLRVHWPATPPPLTDEEIAAALEQPVGQPTLRELARGASRPVVIVDDLTRPTPAERILPLLLRQLAEAGVAPEKVTIVLGTGSHGRIPRDAVVKKVGAEAASACRLVTHDSTARAVRVGRTSFGTTVRVNREAAASDLVLGIGGAYPQHSTGFGGGSKLALGVLAKRSIVQLHYRHASVAGSYDVSNTFRRDLDEVARLVRLTTTVTVHVDAARRPVRVVAGDHERYYGDAVAFSRTAYEAPLPGGADVVVSNAYPIDVSLTFMRSKGVIPLLHARPGASRVLVASCPEGVGVHRIFPFMETPRFARQLHAGRVLAYRPRAAAGAVARRLGRRRGSSVAEAYPARPILLFVPGRRRGALPEPIPGMTPVYDWGEVLERIEAEQPPGPRETVVYPCAPLQVLELSKSSRTPALEGLH